MMVRLIVALIALLCSYVGLGGPTYALDATCSRLPIDPSSLRDGQLFRQVRVNGIVTWAEFTGETPPDYTGGQKPRFIYVIKEAVGERSGLLIVKTGRQLPDGEATSPVKSVHLRRHDYGDLPREDCSFTRFGRDRLRRFGGNRVLADSYDQYHDVGYIPVDKRDYGVLDKFHTKYVGRNEECKDSNETKSDNLLYWWRRNNRSQFSFDPDVVKRGPYIQILRARPYAQPIVGSTGLVDQRVQVLRYRTDEGLACMLIGPRVSGPNFFIRVNDLEAGHVWRGSFFRGPEVSRWLTR